MVAMEKGCKLTVIDIRANVSATKAHRFLMIRPGSDYALNLAVIHTLINRRLYNVEYVNRWFKDFDVLEQFAKPYTLNGLNRKPESRQTKSSVLPRTWPRTRRPCSGIRGRWMNARYSDSFYMSRTIYIINALLGSIGAKGGLPMVNKPGDVGRKGLKKLTRSGAQSQ